MAGYVEDKILQFEYGGKSANALTHHLPHWSRVPTLDKNRYPLAFAHDVLQPESVPDLTARSDNDLAKALTAQEFPLTSTQNNPHQRIQYLEKNINFLRVQHREILEKLHLEIDALKQQNKDLQYKIVAINLGKDGGESLPPTNEAVYDQSVMEAAEPLMNDTFNLETRLLSDQLVAARQQLDEANKKNDLLTSVVLKLEHENRRLNHKPDLEKIASMTTPVMIQKDTDRIPRRPTLQEYETLVRHLQKLNQQQASEIERLRMDLKELLYKQKVDRLPSAKSDVSNKPSESLTTISKLPQVVKELPKPFALHLANYNTAAQSVTLPALHTSLGNKAVERRKKTQILYKAKLRQEHIDGFGVTL